MVKALPPRTPNSQARSGSAAACAADAATITCQTGNSRGRRGWLAADRVRIGGELTNTKAHLHALINEFAAVRAHAAELGVVGVVGGAKATALEIHARVADWEARMPTIKNANKRDRGWSKDTRTKVVAALWDASRCILDLDAQVCKLRDDIATAPAGAVAGPAA